MDCKKCVNKCKAEYCTLIPIPIETWNKHKEKVINNKDLRYEIFKETGVVFALINSKCPFLDAEYMCSIYEDRPEVCRIFGDESNILMTCKWQDKDGRMRSRQERRQVEKKQQDEQAKCFKDCK